MLRLLINCLTMAMFEHQVYVPVVSSSSSKALTGLVSDKLWQCLRSSRLNHFGSSLPHKKKQAIDATWTLQCGLPVYTLLELNNETLCLLNQRMIKQVLDAKGYINELDGHLTPWLHATKRIWSSVKQSSNVSTWMLRFWGKSFIHEALRVSPKYLTNELIALF